ncbi:M15 family metallopeptidase [Neptunicella sp. SCSIO 80796]|uniref:M15 family metallopeptidase n=1 Tax=Neptunicella plasticusilytica TaxID=3117012 RepID=UPI003A4DAD15
MGKTRMMLFSLSVVSTLALAEAQMPTDFIDVAKVIPNAVFDLRYATDNNFVGQPVDGYRNAACILKKDAAKALKKVYQAAAEQGLNLYFFDCYRPQRAVDHFVRWVNDATDTRTKKDYYPNLAKDKLLGGYIAAKSGHSRGYTVDMTIAEKNAQGQWQPIDMGGSFDFFDPISNTDDPRVTPVQRENRYRLKALMEAQDFIPYDMEWWHFSYSADGKQKNKVYYDFPVK